MKLPENWQRYALIGGIAVIGAFGVYWIFLRPKPASTTAQTSGTTSSNNALPTYYSGELGPNYTNITENVTTDSNNPVTTTTNTSDDDPSHHVPPPPPPPPPAPAPQPPPTQGPPPPVASNPSGPPIPQPRTITYIVAPGDTLSAIALRFGTSWHALYSFNQNTIDTTAAQHGNPIAGGPWNNIFIGERIQIPQ